MGHSFVAGPGRLPEAQARHPPRPARPTCGHPLGDDYDYVIDKYWVSTASSTATASCCGRPAENLHEIARRPRPAPRVARARLACLPTASG
jgi:hypothetical protein